MKTIEVINARYISGFKIEVFFSDNTSKVVDFESRVQSLKVKAYQKYKYPDTFKQFGIENGNLVWGEDWSLVFPVHQLYKGTIKS